MSGDIKKQIKEALETYNKYAEIYSKYLDTKLLQFQLNEFATLLPKGGKVLDLGCGAGRDIEYLLEDGFDITGIDISDELLKKAKAKKLPVKKMDMTKLTFKDNSFDGVWSMASLSDLQKSNAKKLLKKLYQILKPNGILYIAVKEGEGERIIPKEKYLNAPRFYAFYKKTELETLLKENNFTIITSKETKDGPTGWIEIFARKK